MCWLGIYGEIPYVGGRNYDVPLSASNLIIYDGECVLLSSLSYPKGPTATATREEKT